MRASWVTIHHEGAGAPTDNVARFLDTDKYSAGIGVTRYELRRDPADSFVTTGQSGHCLQVCLSGNRMVHAVTDDDLELIRQCCADARGRGWLVDNPDVKHHGDNGKTACPGTHANDRRAAIRSACQAWEPAPSPSPGSRREVMLIEQPARTADPVRLAVAELRPDDQQIICWNGASIAGDFLFVAGDNQRRGEVRVVDLRPLTHGTRVSGWVDGDRGPIVLADEATFYFDWS